jgi:hypothetical protein
MRSIFLILTLMLVSISSMATEIETVPNIPRVENIFVPPGFDDFDESEITYWVQEPNTCYLKTYNLPPQIDHNRKIIKISNLSKKVKLDVCARRLKEYPKTVSLGELRQGTYEIQFQVGDGKFETVERISIEKSSVPTVDEFEYANVDENQLTVSVDPVGRQVELNLSGSFPNSCYDFKEIKVLQRSDKVIEVLPIIQRVKDSCDDEVQQAYSIKKIIDYTDTELSRKLVHIRVANGHAINRVVYIK